MRLSVNTTHPHYNEYLLREQQYKKEMYDITSEPQRECKQFNFVWQSMDYAEGSFAVDLVTMLLNFGPDLISRDASDPPIYQACMNRIEWLNAPTAQVTIQTQNGPLYFYKHTIRDDFYKFLVKNLVKQIPLPPKSIAP